MEATQLSGKSPRVGPEEAVEVHRREENRRPMKSKSRETTVSFERLKRFRYYKEKEKWKMNGCE